MINTYGVIKDNKILAVYETSDLLGVAASLIYDNIKDYDEILELNHGAEIKQGFDIREYDQEYNLKPVADRVNDGFIILSDDEEIKDNQIVKKIVPEVEKTLSEYKEFKIRELSGRCYFESQNIFPVMKQINVLVGANDYYPEYLQGETGIKNVKNFIQVYQQIYKVNAVLINAAVTKDEVDNIIKNLSFPTESDFIKNMAV